MTVNYSYTPIADAAKCFNTTEYQILEHAAEGKLNLCVPVPENCTVFAATLLDINNPSRWTNTARHPPMPVAEAYPQIRLLIVPLDECKKLLCKGTRINFIHFRLGVEMTTESSHERKPEPQLRMQIGCGQQIHQTFDPVFVLYVRVANGYSNQRFFSPDALGCPQLITIQQQDLCIANHERKTLEELVANDSLNNENPLKIEKNNINPDESISTARTRDDLLAVVIKNIYTQNDNLSDTSAAWNILVGMANQKIPPLLEFIGGDIKWINSKDEAQLLSKKRFGDRYRRLKKIN